MPYIAVMDSSLGVYVHVPFCARVCPYCDFAVEASQSGGAAWAAIEDEYVDTLQAELALRRSSFQGRTLASLYFGGGTPSLFRPDSLARIRQAVEKAFPPGPEPVEVTIEVNPSSVERQRLPAFREEAGVSRLSVGVQSFDDSILKALGRAHQADECRRTLAEARAAGFKNLSLDLMFAVPGQTPAMLESDLAEALRFEPEHVSGYELVFEAGTPFGRASAEGRLAAFPEDACAGMVETIEARLGAAGYRRYELTNYARPGQESVHNRRYWQRRAVLGLGVGAHSTDPPAPGRPHGSRHANPRQRAAWTGSVAGGQCPVGEEEVLDRRTAMAEACFLALRCEEGLDAAGFQAEFGASPRQVFGALIEGFVGQGLLDETAGGGLRLTGRGRELADTVCAEFV